MRVLQIAVALLLVQASIAGLTKIGLSELQQLDYDGLTCESPQYHQVRKALLQWKEAFQMHEEGSLQNDIKMLSEIKVIAKSGMDIHDDTAFIQQSGSMNEMLNKKFAQLKLAKSGADLGAAQCNQLRKQIEQIMNSDDPDERRQCCAMLYGLVEYMIQQMEQLQQCCNTPVVININGQIDKLEIIGGNCEATPISVPPPKPKDKAPEVVVIPKEAGPVCVEGATEITDSQFDKNESVIDTEISGDDLKGVNQYGYGYWFKFTTHYPGKMFRGKTRDQYYMSRLTQNKDFKDAQIGDRTLMIFLGRGYFDFYTYDKVSNQLDVKLQLPYGDIEGEWLFTYFSYGSGRATAFLHQPNHGTKTKTVKVEHLPVNYLRLLMGGKDRDIYEGFNGQLNRPLFRLGKGSYIDNVPNFDKYILACNPHAVETYPLGMIEVVDAIEDFTKGPVEPNPVGVSFKMPEEYSAGGWFRWTIPMKNKEWAIAYRVTIIDEDVLQDQVFLGDRDLTVFIQKSGTMRFATYSYFNLEGVGNPSIHKDIKNCYSPGEWHYIYTGYSRPLRKTIAFVDCGGKKIDIEFPQTNHFLSQTQTVFVAKDPFYEQYPGQVQHFTLNYQEGCFDPQYEPVQTPQPTPSVPVPVEESPDMEFSEKEVPKTPTPPKEVEPTPPKEVEPTPTKEAEPTPPKEVEPIPPKDVEPTPAGEESKRRPPPFTLPPPAPRKPGKKPPKSSVPEQPPTPPKITNPEVEKPPSVPVPPSPTPIVLTPPTFQNVCIEGSADILDAGFKGNDIAKIDIAEGDLEDSSEYGYGFWLRFLSKHPDQLLNGLDKPKYFVGRLTENVPYKDQQQGDRALATFFTAAGFVYSTYDSSTNKNVIDGTIQFTSPDVEGVWLYTYFSYSAQEGRSVAYLVYQNKDPLEVVIEGTHNIPSQLRFILGGTDNGNYPGFNGQFSRPTLRVGEGAFLGTPDDLQAYARSCNPVPPPDCTELKIIKYLDKRTRFRGEDPTPEKVQYFESPDEQRFPSTYSAQGWFKLALGIEQKPWHSLFRLTSHLPTQNQNAKRLGDRTLSAFIGTLAGGVLTFSTYSYEGLEGKGNPNVHESMPHHGQVTQWHYVYFLYQREHRSAFAEVSFKKGKVEQQFVDINHFLTSKQYLYIGKDQYYPSFNGYIARFKLNLCGTKYHPEFLTPTPDQPIPTPSRTPTPYKPVEITPSPPPQTDQICLGEAPYIEVTADNIDKVIEMLRQHKQNLGQGVRQESDLCYCTFATPQYGSVLVQLNTNHLRARI